MTVFLPVLFCCNASADDITVKKVHAEIVSENIERVCIQLSDYFLPTLQGIEGKKPRVFVDIYNVSKWNGPPTINLNGDMILQVRTHLHRKEAILRIVVDLKPFGNYFIGQTYIESGNIFCISVVSEHDQM